LTRQECEVDDMIRFVRGPDGGIAPDLSGKLGGRGVWINGTSAAVAEAARRNVFSKSLKSNAKVSADLADLVGRLLRERMRQALSFAAKAGLVTSGYTKVDEALEAGRVMVLLQASNAADDGAVRLRSKFEGLARTRGRSAPVIRQFTSEELSMALGRTNVVHASLAEGGQTSAFLRESLRFERFRLNDGTRSASLPDMPSGSAGGLDTGNV
jgi:uncharacterized protein